jgi:hypothetical protein
MIVMIFDKPGTRALIYQTIKEQATSMAIMIMETKDVQLS